MTEAILASIDPNYTEPPTVEELGTRFDKALTLIFGEDGAITENNKPLYDVIVDTFKRITALEAAMLPFGIQTALIANAQMNLTAANRTDAPGGIWIQKLDKCQVYANAYIFFGLSDVLGRKKIETHMENIFKEVQERATVQEEKNKHVAEGGTVQ